MAYASSSPPETVMDLALVNEGVPAALRLSPSQLAEVLTCVPLDQRLRCCALVCKAFHAASVLATRQVVFTTCMPEDRYTAGFRWLQAHGQAAGVTSIIFRTNLSTASDPTQQLPWDQLAVLQQLELSCPVIQPLPAAVLTSLTYLHCQQCDGSVAELAAFTQLRHLALAGHPLWHSNSTGSQLLGFQRALPHLRGLTHPVRSTVSNSLAQDAVLQPAVQKLRCLQDLRLNSSSCSAATFTALPVSLTRLEVVCARPQQLELPLSSATHFQRLTALQHFALYCAHDVHPSVLAVLTGLTQLQLFCCKLIAGHQEAGWYCLSGLANLQHLYLYGTMTGPPRSPAPKLTAADIAALTASNQLTYLYISNQVARPKHYKHLLPAARHLQDLKELYATMDLAADPQVTVQLPHCCPNLQVLDLTAPVEGPAVGKFADGEFAILCHALEALPELRKLELHMSAVNHSEPATWEALGGLDQLHSLGLICVQWEALHNVLQLTTCAQLTRLRVHAWSSPQVDHEGEFEVINEAPAGHPSDVWSKMPQMLLDALQSYQQAEGAQDADSPTHMAQP